MGAAGGGACWRAGAERVRGADPALGELARRLEAAGGAPPRGLEPGPRVPGGCFEALAKSVAYQQLAGKAAGSIWTRVVQTLGGRVEPGLVLRAGEALREAGLSGSKAECIRALARAFEAGDLSDAELESADEAAVVRSVTAIKGIGAWTADMFLIFHLRRPDVLPVGDYGVRKGFMKVYGLSALPDAARMRKIAEVWRPYRSVGALYMWQAADDKGSGKAGPNSGSSEGKKRAKRTGENTPPVAPSKKSRQQQPRSESARKKAEGGGRASARKRLRCT